MSKLIMMKGLPASGKSTLAKKIIEVNPNTVRVNKDLLRKMLNFSNWTWQNEKEVQNLEEFIAQSFLNVGIDVIVDDTNLTEYHENKWKNRAKENKAEFVKIEMNTPIEVCVKRDSFREDSVGKEVIRNFALSIGKVEGNFIICDLDGTLCDITDRKYLVSSKDEKSWEKFFEKIPEDKVREDVAEAIKFANDYGFKIVYLSGRPEEYKQQTLEWLKKHGLDFHFSLIMRKKGDRRDDVIVKREMLNKYFKDRSKIYRVFDDRPKVVRMWKEELGDYRVTDVGDGIEF